MTQHHWSLDLLPVGEEGFSEGHSRGSVQEPQVCECVGVDICRSVVCGGTIGVRVCGVWRSEYIQLV